MEAWDENRNFVRKVQTSDSPHVARDRLQDCVEAVAFVGKRGECVMSKNIERQRDRATIQAIEAWCEQMESVGVGDVERFDEASRDFRAASVKSKELGELVEESRNES